MKKVTEIRKLDFMRMLQKSEEFQMFQFTQKHWQMVNRITRNTEVKMKQLKKY